MPSDRTPRRIGTFQLLEEVKFIIKLELDFGVLQNILLILQILQYEAHFAFVIKLTPVLVFFASNVKAMGPSDSITEITTFSFF